MLLGHFASSLDGLSQQLMDARGAPRDGLVGPCTSVRAVGAAFVKELLKASITTTRSDFDERARCVGSELGRL